MEPTVVEEDAKQKYRQLFQSLEPDGGDRIHVSTFKELLKNGQGDEYDEERATEMIEDLRPGVDGTISIDELAEYFSLGPRSSKFATALHNVLQFCPELLPTIPNLKKVLDKLGSDIRPEEAIDIVDKARQTFVDCLGKRTVEEDPPGNKKEAKEKRMELLQMFQEQIRSLGGVVPNLDDEEVESD